MRNTGSTIHKDQYPIELQQDFCLLNHSCNVLSYAHVTNIYPRETKITKLRMQTRSEPQMCSLIASAPAEATHSS